jgi:hypothetical protein
MPGRVTDLVLTLLDDVERSALCGAHDLNDKVKRLNRIRDFRIVERAILWCASDEINLKQLGGDALVVPERLSDFEIDRVAALSRDDNAEVRSWAMFLFSSQCNADGERIREILIERSTDSHDETRGEAILALAQRRDARASELIRRELERDLVGTLAVEAAEELGDPHLLPSLMHIKSWWDVDESLLQRAIKACGG